MKSYFQAECLKCRHTSVNKLMVMMPLCSVILSAFLTNKYFGIDSYNWWYVVLFPGMIALICGVIGCKDKKQQNRTIWTLPVDMGKIWNGKVLLGIRVSGVALIFFLILVLVGSWILRNIMDVSFVIEPSVGAQVLAIIILWLCCLWQIPFCLFLSQVMGTFPMLLLHMGTFTVMSVILSLKPYFMFFPGALSARMMCTVLGVLPNGLLAVEGQATYSPELVRASSLAAGIPAAIFWFLLFWIIGKRWFERQVAI